MSSGSLTSVALSSQQIRVEWPQLTCGWVLLWLFLSPLRPPPAPPPFYTERVGQWGLTGRPEIFVLYDETLCFTSPTSTNTYISTLATLSSQRRQEPTCDDCERPSYSKRAADRGYSGSEEQMSYFRHSRVSHSTNTLNLLYGSIAWSVTRRVCSYVQYLLLTPRWWPTLHSTTPFSSILCVEYSLFEYIFLYDKLFSP